MASEADVEREGAQPSPAPMKASPAARPVDFVKKVGKGRTLSADLTAGESRTAFHLLLNGAFLPVQAGAFLQALRIKELTQAELDALAETFRDRMGTAPPLIGRHTLVLNLASDTQRKGGLVSLLAAGLLRRFGVAVGIVRSAPVLQGNTASFDASWALATRMDAEGALFPVPAAQAAGFAPPPVRVDCGDMIAGLASLDALRSQLGFRSCLHTAEKLINPWPASPLLLGISHKHYALRMAQTMANLGLHGKVLLGNHGTVDLVLHKETEIVSVAPSATGADLVREESVAPEALGLEIPSDIYSLGKFPHWGEWLEAMGGSGPSDAVNLGTPRDNGLRKAIQYHLAVLLWAAGAARDPAAGLAAAQAAIPRLFP
jgi:anthranilate phosphoribosyltransferase